MKSLIFATAACLSLGFAQGRDGPSEPYTAPVESLNALLSDVMASAESLGFEGRLERFSDGLDEVYDYRRMAGVALGRSGWRSLSEDERAAYVDAFAELSAVTYAARFDKTTDNEIVIAGVEEGPRGTVVRTRLVRKSAADVPLDYRVHVNDDTGEARIVDVIYDGGISELAQRRAEYGAAFRDGGFDALMGGIRAAIERQRDDG